MTKKKHQPDQNENGIFRLLSLTHTGFQKQLAITFALGILLLAILSSIAITTFTSQTLRDRIVSEGYKINHNLASQSVLALLYNSPENAEELVTATLAYPDVLSVSLFDIRKQLLLSSGAQLPDDMSFVLDKAALEGVLHEVSDAWFFVEPVYSHAVQEVEASPFNNESKKSEIIGYAVIKFGKHSLEGMATDILKSNLTVSAILSSLLLVILLFITRRMTNPLRDLANIMKKAEGGEYHVRAEVKGPRDIIDMENAFNTMMDALESRDEELVAARDAALESARAKGEFAASVTHELRTPLNGVLGMLELLSGSIDDEGQLQYIEVARSSAESLLLLIDDILDFSRNDAKKSKIEIENFDPRHTVGNVIKLLSVQADKKNLQLSLDVDDAVPQMMLGAKDRIRQILINLIGNAIKFTEEGSVDVRVSINSTPPKQLEGDSVSLLFEIIDTGIGIPEDQLGKIFEVFSQVDGTSTRKFSGSGLGLAICQQLVVEFMGGEIGVDSKINKGSRFWFSLSLEEVEETQAKEQHIDSSEACHPIAPLRLSNKVSVNKNVLVVEDNRTNQQVAQGMLERIGCHVTIASDGREALDIVFRKQFDVVLMDIQMPGMDGYEVTNKIRKLEADGQHIPIVAMTANVHQSDIDHCIAVGMDDFLAKPLKMNLLKDKVFRWFGGSESSATEVSGSQLENASSENPVIDTDVLYELRHNLGDGFPEVLKTYLEDMPVYTENIEKALITKNSKLLDITAHTLKGSSRNIGAMRVAALCKRLEDQGKSGSTEGMNSVCEELLLESDSVRKALESELRVDDITGSQKIDNSINVLVVDDDRSMRLALKQVLEKDGYSIEEACTGGQVIESCKKSIPDLILLDAMMPGVDGFSACEQLRQMKGCEHIPILIITALEDSASIERAFRVGATDYIPKPVNFAVLRQRISRLMNASQAEKHVRHLAYHDPLTGLPNRATFIDNLKRLINRPRTEGKILAVFFIDLDRFKLVNDTLGHDVGDKLLKVASERLLGSVRKTDVVARLGGDEFTIILDGVKSETIVAKIADKICTSMAEPFLFKEQKIYVSASIGISLYPNDASDFHELIKYADTAMFKAKENRGGFRFYESEMEATVVRRMELETELRAAIKNQEFVLHYQPQMSMANEQIVAMEALVRWNHPRGKMVLPSEFIPLAEETGLIAELGEWVLREGCSQLRRWMDKGYPPIKLAINLSSKQFEDKFLAAKVQSILQSENISPEYLELEITESAIMKNPEEAMEILRQLSDMGITLAIDDFGTGHSSLSYLRRLPVDTLKIDRSFVSDILTSPQDAAVITGIIALAKSLGLKVVAEGVETHEQKNFLKEQACDLLQGYYLYKPLPAETFEQVIFTQKQATNF